MHTCTHLLPLSYTLFIAASGRCVIYISLSRAQLCACVFFYVCVFFFLLMHRDVILWHFFRALNSHLNHVEALCWECSHSRRASPESVRLVLLRRRQTSPVDIWMETFRSCLSKHWCKIQTWGNRWLKWNGHSCTVLSQIVDHELERSDTLVILPVQGLVWATVWGLFLIYRSDSTIEALLPNGGLSHEVLT